MVKWPKTPASHAGNMGSNPVRVTNARKVRIKQNRKYIFGKTESVCKLVFIVMRVHPFPFRTRKLSSSTPKILCGRLHGKIGRCQHLYSSIAQSVERMTVNHDVTGSSPVGGAKKNSSTKWGCSFLFTQADSEAGTYSFRKKTTI